ncbi:unnamed protein product [Albugo candida]|uniref:RBR-type E3 ubiquitin transferase n=2 Tax=Albugo candida TaxID=65357 RepID=A0A024GN76_9STRA|nr:unnamed protein product [Albugo candida]|eukprot:CCI48337.1 unnamed protein product [Albugo candida]
MSSDSGELSRNSILSSRSFTQTAKRSNQSNNSMSDDEYHYSDYEDEEQDGNDGVSGLCVDPFDTDQHPARLGATESHFDNLKENQFDESALEANQTLFDKENTKKSYSNRHNVLGKSSQIIEIPESISAPFSQREEYRVIDEKELLQEQEHLIDEIAQVVQVPQSVACIILEYYGWNKEKLFENYYLDPFEARKIIGIEFSGQVPSKVTAVSMIVNSDILKKFVSDEDFRKYRRYLLRSYVQINKCVKWCPSPGCNKAISSAGGLLSVTCSCGCVFCLRCGEEAHAPVTCVQLAAWQEKCRNESETANWILANTKKCPKCSVRIEKNQGCNHITCKSCNYEFCWICLESWSKHGAATGGYYKCNRYDAQATVADSDAARAKAELDRYLHYYQRYANHSEAGKFSSRMREGTESRMVELQRSHRQSSWIDVQFLNASTEQLIECRRVLKYTYVLGYYLLPGKEKSLFEYLQENLEKNTEHLTGLIEGPLELMDRSDIINYTRVTETFLRNLLAGVEDGLTNNVTMTRNE